MNPRALLAVTVGVLALAVVAQAQARDVRTEPQLRAAIGQATPGATIRIAPGRYRLTRRLTIGRRSSGTARKKVVIRPRGKAGSVVIDAAGAEEAFHVTDARHVDIRGLWITNGDYHAIKIDAPSRYIRVIGNRMWDNTRGSGLSNQFSAIKGGGRCPSAGCAARVTIDANVIFQKKRFQGSNFQGIDCNACVAWRVRRNRIANIRGTTLAGTGIQFKSGSAGTVIARNTVTGSGLVGINYGGFGTPAWGNRTHEHVGGIVKNNVVTRSADAGISVIDTVNGKVLNNTLWGNGFTPDVRVAASNLIYRNNILDRPLNRRDGTRAKQGGNLVLASSSARGLFLGAKRGDFRLRASARRAINRGVSVGRLVRVDRSGRKRPRGGRIDIGAYER